MAVAKEKLYLWMVVVLSLAIALTEGRQIHGFDNTKFDFPMLPKNIPIPPSGPNPRDPNIPPPAPTDQFYDPNNFNFGVLPKGRLNRPSPNKAEGLSPPPPPTEGSTHIPIIPPPATTEQFYDSNNFNFGVLPNGRLHPSSPNAARGLSPPLAPTRGSSPFGVN